jgi:benzoate membrane transport protein
MPHVLKTLKNDFSLTAFIAGFVIVLVGITSSAVIVFQAAQAFGGNAAMAGSWLGSLCLGTGILTVYFSLKYKKPVLMAWSTPGAILLLSVTKEWTMSQAVGVFLLTSILTFLFGITGIFEKIMNRIPSELTSALLAGVLFHFCLDVFTFLTQKIPLVGGMLITYFLFRKIKPHMTMLFVLAAGIFISLLQNAFTFQNLEWTWTKFNFTTPELSLPAFISFGIPLFIVTMTSQNMTGLSVMREHKYNTPLSPLLTGMGLMNILIAFLGGFSINLAAITAALGMGKDVHQDHNKRYVAAVVAGTLYTVIGFCAGTITSLFSILPKEIIFTVAGLALFATVSSSLEKALANPESKDASFITFLIAASGISFYKISSAFWAILIGLMVLWFMTLKTKRMVK